MPRPDSSSSSSSLSTDKSSSTSTTSSTVVESESSTSNTRTVSPANTPSPQPVVDSATKKKPKADVKKKPTVSKAASNKKKPTHKVAGSTSSDLESIPESSKSSSSNNSSGSGSSLESISSEADKKKKPTPVIHLASGKKSGQMKGKASPVPQKKKANESESTSLSSESSSSSFSSSSSSFRPANKTSTPNRQRTPYSTSRGPRYNASATPRQIKVLSESSSSSESSDSGKNKRKNISNSDSDSDGEGSDSNEMMINEDSLSGSDEENEINNDQQRDGSDDEDDDEVYVVEDGQGKRKRSTSNENGVELSVSVSSKKKKGKKGKGSDDDNEDDEDGSNQKPHKHKSGHKKDVLPDDEDGNEGDAEEKERKRKKRKKDRKRRKGKKKGKKKKKKSLKKRFVKTIRRFGRFAVSSIRFATTMFFIVLFIIAVLLIYALTEGVLNQLRNSDFEAGEIDIDRISKSVYDDLDKLSGILGRYSKWDDTIDAIEDYVNGDPTTLENWYNASFIWDGEWTTTQGHNLLALYDVNHNCIYADYHPCVNFTQSTAEAPVPDYIRYNMSTVFSSLSKAMKKEKDDERLCMVTVPQGSNTAMLVCQHKVVSNTVDDGVVHGYIIMAMDFQSRMTRYAREIFSCVSLWDNPTYDTPDSEPAAGLKAGGIGTDGCWTGDVYNKHYKVNEMKRLVEESGTIRICSDTQKFEEKKNSVGSYMLFPNRLPGHNPGPLVRVDHPAAMEDYARSPMTILIVVSLAAFLVFCVVLLVYLDLVVLRRISSLSKFLDSLTKEASKERQDILETHKIYDDDFDKNTSSKASKRDAPGGVASSKHSKLNRKGSHSHIDDEDEEEDDTTTTTESEDTSTSTASTTSTNSTSTTSTTASTTSTTSTASTTSSKVHSVVSSESTATGNTTTSEDSGATTTTTSSDSNGSTGGGSSGNKHDEVLRVQKSVKTNIDTLKDDITAANVNIKNERHWRRRSMHALRLMNMWCGRKDIFPGLRGKEKPGASSTPIPTGDGSAGGEDGSANEGTRSVTKEDGTRGYEDMSVDDMLDRPIAMEFLKVHSRFEESQENIFFLLDATWLQELERLEEVESDPIKRAQMHDTVVSVADHIVKRYIVQGAPQEINISSESMSIVRQLSGTYSKNMFAKAIYDVKMMTSMDVLSRFKHTPAFLAMSEALDVETYDMMSAVVRRAKSPSNQRKSSGASNLTSSSGGGGGTVSTGEIQVSAPSDRGSADIRSDAFGDSDDEDEDINEFEDDDEDNDNNSITNIDKPFRTTFRLMSAIADGAYKPNVGPGSLTGSMFSSAGGDSLSDSEGGHSTTTTPRSARGTKASAIAVKESKNATNASQTGSQTNSEAEGGDNDESKKSTD